MVEVLVPCAAMWMIVACVAQLRRLITDALLYRAITRVAATDADSARLLIDKVEPRPRHRGALSGWVGIVAATAIAAAGAFNEGAERWQAFEIATLLAVISGGVLAFSWWSARSARHAIAAT